VFNGSPLFTGAAESGESRIRQWILENDWLEAIVALPDQLFYNTGISTYFWILTNNKRPEHRRKVVLLDARDYWTKMRKSLGDKRKRLDQEQIAEVTHLPEALRGRPRTLLQRVRFANTDSSTVSLSSITETAAEISTTPRPPPPPSARGMWTRHLADVKPLLSLGDRDEAFTAVRTERRTALPGAPFTAHCGGIGVRDPEEVQLVKGDRADPTYATTNVPLLDDVEEHCSAVLATSPTPGSTTPRPRLRDPLRATFISKAPASTEIDAELKTSSEIRLSAEVMK
jgi:type I restriction enzyme M protein